MDNRDNEQQIAVVYHPGDTLSEKIREMHMSIKEFAVRTSKPEKTIIAVISGTSSITVDMSVAFENVTKIPARFWMNKQRMYDEYLVRKKREEEAAQSVEWMRCFPIAEMVKLRWIETCKTASEKVCGLYRFFGISTEKAWQDYYMGQKLKMAFRISLTVTRNPYAISAWLRQCELKAMEMDVETTYTEKGLKAAIGTMKQIMTEQPDDFYAKLQACCASVGIKLVNAQCLPKAPIHGATRWLNDTPVIQLSNRYKRYDIFWFTFFHEIGHILLHGKKDVFIEGEIGSEMDVAKETEANEFAAEILLPKKEEDEIVSSGRFDTQTIRRYASKFGTHPSIIAGRLQHLKLIDYWQDQSLICKVEI